MGTHPPEPKKAFLEKMTNILNYGALNLGMALGYQTGLGMMWGRQKAVEMLKTAGFSRIDVAEIPDDPFNLHFLCRKLINCHFCGEKRF